MAGQLEDTLLRQLDRMQSSVEDDELDFDEDENEQRRLSPWTRRRRLRDLHRFLNDFATAPQENDNAERNVSFASEEFNLDRIDREILLLLVRYGRVEGSEEFADKILKVLHSTSRAIAALTGTDPREIHARIASTGTLVDGGLIAVENDDDSYSGLCGRGGFLKLSPPLRKTLYQSHESRADWINAVLGKPLNPSLTWEDFAHLGSNRELAFRVLTGAVNSANRACGVNVLLYGPVGTGKTEFSKTLAAHGGMTIWSVGEVDDMGGESILLGLDVTSIVDKIQSEQRRLFERDIDPETFLRSLYTAYSAVLRSEQRQEADEVPLRRVTNRLAKNLKRFASDEFNIDLSRLVQQGALLVDGRRLQLNHTRNQRQGMLLHGLESGGYVGFISFKPERQS